MLISECLSIENVELENIKNVEINLEFVVPSRL